jgi:formate C-acetyltransferase
LPQTKVEEELSKRRSSIKPMNHRIARLREESIANKAKISSERARLITEFYKSGFADGKSEPGIKSR